jgi:hypothetical protein
MAQLFMPQMKIVFSKTTNLNTFLYNLNVFFYNLDVLFYVLLYAQLSFLLSKISNLSALFYVRLGSKTFKLNILFCVQLGAAL